MTISIHSYISYQIAINIYNYHLHLFVIIILQGVC